MEDMAMLVINPSPPTDWRDLQVQVSKILEECGLISEIDKNITTVRGTVKVDVHAEDSRNQPLTIYLCECKHWQTNVPKSIVHALRTVVADYGANWGFIISSAGFQSGAYTAASKSNVRLLTWDEFQQLFIDRWIENYMVPRLRGEVEPLVEYTEPINSRIFRKADQLNGDSQQRFIELREKYDTLAFLALHHYVDLPLRRRPDLPLRTASQNRTANGQLNLSDELLDATCLRDFVDVICREAQEAVRAFDLVFGGRA